MPKYVIEFAANPAAWPSDPKQVLATWEGVLDGAEMLIKEGLIEEVNWFSGTEGFAIIEARTKADAVGIVTPFFPLFSQQIREIVAFDDAKQSIIAGLKKAVG